MTEFSWFLANASRYYGFGVWRSGSVTVGPSDLMYIQLLKHDPRSSDL